MRRHLKDYRKRIQTANAILEDGAESGSDPGKELKVVVEKDLFASVYTIKRNYDPCRYRGCLLYREDNNHRRIHTSQIEADDCMVLVKKAVN